jgi:hypothetical protein
LADALQIFIANGKIEIARRPSEEGRRIVATGQNRTF